MKKNYKKCYKMYKEAKREIKEIPLPYADWMYLEKDAEREWKKCKKVI